MIAYMIEETRIGHFEKYHNVLKIVVWVVPQVNVTLGLSFAHDLHGLSKTFFAYLRERSGNVAQSILLILLCLSLLSGVRQREK